MIALFSKAPPDVLDYDIDYGRDWLHAGDRIIDARAAIAAREGNDDGLSAVEIHGTSVSTTVVKVWLRGGRHGEIATIEVVAETAGGRVKAARFRVAVRTG